MKPTKTAKCVIVDDEHLARKLLTDYISKLPQLELIGSFSSPLDIIDLVATNKVDLLFLDIQMPDMTGIEFMKTMDIKPLVIFTTAYSEYALEGYELNVIEYLLKPISFSRFVKAINKATKILEGRRLVMKSMFQKSDTTSPSSTTENEGHFMVKADKRIYKLRYSEILYVEGALEYVTFHTTSRTITAYYSLKELTELLPSDIFMRIHRSFIINTTKIEALEGNQFIINEKHIPIGQSFKSDAIKMFEK